MKDSIDGFDLSRKIQMHQRIIADIFLATHTDCVVKSGTNVSQNKCLNNNELYCC